MWPSDREQWDQRGEEKLCSIDPDTRPEAADRELHIGFSHTLWWACIWLTPSNLLCTMSANRLCGTERESSFIMWTNFLWRAGFGFFLSDYDCVLVESQIMVWSVWSLLPLEEWIFPDSPKNARFKAADWFAVKRLLKLFLLLSTNPTKDQNQTHVQISSALTKVLNLKPAITDFSTTCRHR